jgi:hypothetical protein
MPALQFLSNSLLPWDCETPVKPGAIRVPDRIVLKTRDLSRQVKLFCKILRKFDEYRARRPSIMALAERKLVCMDHLLLIGLTTGHILVILITLLALFRTARPTTIRALVYRGRPAEAAGARWSALDMTLG